MEDRLDQCCPIFSDGECNIRMDLGINDPESSISVICLRKVNLLIFGHGRAEPILGVPVIDLPECGTGSYREAWREDIGLWKVALRGKPFVNVLLLQRFRKFHRFLEMDLRCQVRDPGATSLTVIRQAAFTEHSSLTQQSIVLPHFGILQGIFGII